MINHEFVPALPESDDPGVQRGATSTVIVTQQKNGYVVSYAARDYGRRLPPGVIALTIDDAIDQAKILVETELRELFKVPKQVHEWKVEANSPSAGNGVSGGIEAAERVSKMRFADGRTHRITEGKPE